MKSYFRVSKQWITKYLQTYVIYASGVYMQETYPTENNNFGAN